MKFYHLLGLFILVLSSTSKASGILFPNFREGGISAYDYTVDQKIYHNLADEISTDQSLLWQKEYELTFTEGQGYCFQTHLDFLNNKLSQIPGAKLQKLLSYIKLLRDRALLDDFSYDYLFNIVNNNSDNSFPLPRFTNEQKERMAKVGTVQSTSQLKKITSTIKGMRRTLKGNTCKDELYHAILKEGKDAGSVTTSNRWQNFLSQLYRHRVINKIEFRIVLSMAKGKLFQRNLTLERYRKKLLTINEIFSINKEDSTTYFKQFKNPGELSDRMQLYNNTKINSYTFKKIKSIIENLIERLSGDEIGVFILNNDKSKKDYRFSSLQQQRYALWMLQYEISDKEFIIATKDRGITMQTVFSIGYEIGLFSGNDMEGISVLRNMLEPKVDDGVQWEAILQESFTAGIFLFPEKRTLLLLSSILVELFFPSKDEVKELHVF